MTSNLGYACEWLEPRRLLATLFVDGTNSADTITLDVDANFIFASVNGTVIPQPVGLWENIRIRALGGNDTIHIRSTGAKDVDVDPGSGADFIGICDDVGHDLNTITSRVSIELSTDTLDNTIVIDDSSDGGVDSYLIDDTPGPLRLVKPGQSGEIVFVAVDANTTIHMNGNGGNLDIGSTIRPITLNESDASLRVLSAGGNVSGEFLGEISNNVALTVDFNGQGTMLFTGDVFAGNATIACDVSLLTISDDAATDTYRTTSGQIDLIDGAQTGTFFYTADSIGLTSTHSTQGSDFNIESVQPGTNLVISAGAGSDTFDVNVVLAGNSADLTFSGGSGTDTMTLNALDILPSGNTFHIFENASYDRSDSVFGLLSYSSISSLTFNGSPGIDHLTVGTGLALTQLILFGGGNADDFEITPSSSTELFCNGDDPTSGSGDSLTLIGGGASGGILNPVGSDGGIYLFSNRQRITFDEMESFTQPALAPSPADLAAVDDTGLLSTDNITNLTTLTFSGTDVVEPNPVKVFRDNVLVATVAATGGSWTTDINFPTGDNQFVMVVRYEVTATGLLSHPSAGLVVRVDTIVPFTPAAPDLTAATDTGISDTDNLTFIPSPDFTGTVEPSAIVTLRDGTTQVGQGFALGSGIYNMTCSPLSHGVHSMTVRQTDIAGNNSGFSPALSIAIDAIFPAPPSGPPDLLDTSDSGINNSDNITFDSTPTFAASGPELIRLFAGASVVADYASAPNVTSSLLADGTYSMTIRSVDLAGNQSTASTALSITIDTIAPAAPSAAPDLLAASDSGISSTDNITNDTTPTFAGSVPVNDIVRLFDAANLVGSDTTTATGTYNITSSTLADGLHPMTTRLEDIAGNVSGPGPTLNVTIDTSAPSAPTTAPDLAAASDTGVSSTDNITADNTPTFTGIGLANGIARLFASGVEVGFDQTNVFPFSYSITSSMLSDGNKIMTTRFEDLAGNQSGNSPSLVVRIDTLAPQVSSAGFNFLTSQDLRYVFSEDVGPTLTTADLTLRNTTTSTTVATSLAYNANVAIFTWPSLPGSTLTDGDYIATLLSAGITDIAGNVLQTNHLLNFFFLSGDANRDRRVNLLDFNIVAANFGQSSRNFSEGDFNYDTIVNLTDFNILASRFGAALGAPAEAPSEFSNLDQAVLGLPFGGGGSVCTSGSGPASDWPKLPASLLKSSRFTFPV